MVGTHASEEGTGSSGALASMGERSVRSAVYRTWHAIRQQIGRYPSLYMPLIALRPSRRDRVVSADTDVVVEGYPRSGNTFVVAALRVANGPDLDVAHHFHVSGHVKRAVQMRVPTLLVVRYPVDAATSLLIQQPFLNAERVLLDYVRFHEDVWPLRTGFVIAPFEVVISDLGICVDALNRRFGTSIERIEHTPELVSEAYALIEAHNRSRFGGDLNPRDIGRPSQHREDLKAQVLGEVTATRLAGLRGRAEDLHRRFVSDPDALREG